MALSSRRPSRTITINPVVFFSTAIPQSHLKRVIMSWGDPLWTFYWWHVSPHRSERCSEAVLVSSFSLSQMVIGLLGAAGPITISRRLCWSQSHCFPQASSLIPPPYLHLSLSLFKKDLLFTCVWMYVHMCVDACGGQKKPDALKLKF